MRVFIVLLAVLAVTAEGFILDDLFGASTSCKSDSDCSHGCCLVKTSSFLGSSGTCHPYLLPGAPCYQNDTLACDCMQGYTCDVPDVSGLAFEDGTKIEGNCKPQDGFTGGPQIAVEGGR